MEEFELIRCHRRSIALILNEDGGLTVRAPLRASLREIEEFVASKHAWIRSKRREIKPRPQRIFADGQCFLFYGREYPLQIVDHALEPLAWNDGFILDRAYRQQGKMLFIKWYKKQAFRIICQRVREYGGITGLTPKSVHISHAQKQWGSCHPTGDLYFSWRLILAPPEIVDYVVVHELSHLKFHDHSLRFWREVAQWIPDYKSRIQWLKQHQHELNL